jgi:hypothetical protein
MAWAVVVTLFGVAGGPASDAAARLTQGKLDVDLGRPAEAAKAFEAVAGDAGAAAPLRAEALVRLGLVRRSQGDEKGAAQAFARVWKDHRQDKEAVAQLVRALGGALPGGRRWDEVWQKVVVRIEPDRPAATIEWPGVPAQRRQAASGVLPPREAGAPSDPPGFVRRGGAPVRPAEAADRISLDFKDGDLNDIFRLFADITGLNVVVHPGTQGVVTYQGKDVPWDEVLERLLAPHGLVYSRVGPVLEIGRPENVPAPRRFEGKAAHFDFQRVELEDALRQVAQRGARGLAVAPGVAGHVTLKLVGVPWDQAFDLVARLNGLDWSDDGTTLRVAPRSPGR